MDYISLQFPESLKEAEDQRFFLSLFTEDNENGFITDKIISNKVCKIGIKQKVFREINKAIYVLSKGEDIPKIGSKANIQLHEKSNARAICMLVGLKYYFKEIQPSLIDSLQGKSLTFQAPSSDKEWILSYPLLLVQAVRFSQWEWENQDYCFEYFSAKLACAKLEAILNKSFSNGFNENKEIALKTITRLIRWQTLHGQYDRCTSTFDVDDDMLFLDRNGKIEDKGILSKMLNAISYADHFLKFKKSHNEKIISALLKNDEINRLLIDDAKYNDSDFQWGDREEFESDKLKPELSEKKNKPKIILSYFSGCPEELKNKILNKILDDYPDNIENRFTHIIINRKQSDLGLCKQLKELCSEIKKSSHELSDLVDEFIFKDPDKILLSANGLPDERIFLVSYKPKKIFFANRLYDLQMDENREYVPIEFLEEAIKKCKENFNVIPLPMIKRITDLLRFFKELEGEKDKVFPAYIIFSSENKIETTVEVWLPEIEKETILKDLDFFEKDIKEDEDIVIKILGRYLIYVVSNYGMTRLYKKVDIDFSASKSYIPGEPHPWSIVMDKMNEALGVYVFDYYLSLYGSDILEKSYAREEYLAAIDHRRMTDLYQFGQEEEVRKHINEKYILGIDMGATGIKFQFFKINLSKARSEQSCYIDDELCLTEDENHAIPTSRPIGKFRDADDFAAYVFDTLKNRLVNNELFSKTICVGICWPGPIKQNKVVGTSGALTNFAGIKGRIMEDSRTDILAIDIERALRKKFSEYLNNIISEDNMLTVALINDGDAEAAGLLFGQVNKSHDEKGKEFYKSLFAEHSVAIIKAGTGTAGSVTVNGRFEGFNEFGKVIVDLGISNERNNTTNRNDRWPLGDANKFFSMRFLKEEATAAGILGAWVEGRDIELLVDVIKNKTSLEEKKKYFGALELVTLARPNIEYSELEERIREREENTIVNYNAEDGYYLKKDENKGLPNHAKNNFQQLLAAFGEYRITRLNLRSAFKGHNMQIIENIGKKMGRRLADVVATLNDIYDLKAVFIAGGPVKGNIGKDCIEEFSKEMKKYLYDRFYKDDDLIGNLDEAMQEYKALRQGTKKIELQNIFEKNKFFYSLKTGHDNALLGVAIKGFDCFVIENKIRELQKLAKTCNQDTHNQLKFVTKEEIKHFIDVNAGRLKVTYSNGIITSLESTQRLPDKIQNRVV